MAFKCGRIKDAVAAEFGVSRAQMDSRDRTSRIARPRQVAAYLCRTEIPEMSYPWIGRQFGRDHSTIIFAFDAVTKRMAASAEFAAAVERCRASIASGPSPEAALRRGWHGARV